VRKSNSNRQDASEDKLTLAFFKNKRFEDHCGIALENMERRVCALEANVPLPRCLP
jgi:hypothetical protein